MWLDKFSITLTLLVTLVGTGYCLDCYFCDPLSQGDDCIDYYDKDGNADMMDSCDDKQTHCLKIRTVSTIRDSGYITGKVRKGLTVSRLCVRADGQCDGCSYMKAGNSKVTYCICSTDGCNSANVLIPSFFIFFMILLFSHFLK